ncbi:nuclear transport factor 2 family protein [Citricoccus sp. NPDC055426]|uniref:nuclear transport factor 2 family protein n=1 Tax=Citricoccus sp. NPDC055426 TaxID=3155536 RepID=UPI0034486960
MARIELTELLPLERSGWDALCANRGGRFYGDLMTEHALMVLVNGMVLDRTTVAASLDESPAWSWYRLDDARVVPTGADSAALVYRATAMRDGGAEPFIASMSSHYRRLEGRLRMTLYQQTTITH